MQISSATSLATFTSQAGDPPFSKIKQSFNKLDKALSSGDISDAKDALAQIQNNAPKFAGAANDPMASKMNTLSQALNSGDMSAAQSAYANIKQTMAKGPSGTPPSGAMPPQSNTSGVDSDSGIINMLA